jgi:hypothetical protein
VSEFPTAWFHGSPLRLEVLLSGSTITPFLDLARVFSHKPSVVSLDEQGPELRIRHNGVRPGFLYRVLGVSADAVYPHPRSSMPAGFEWLTREDLRLELVGATEPRPDESLTSAELERIRAWKEQEDSPHE